jgi:predicted ATP-grasp superfamily ATP-dependent carboligase
MGKRVLVTGAGTAAAENLVRSLKAGDPELLVLGCHSDRFILKKSSCERRYLIPRANDPQFRGALCRLADKEQIDLLVPTSDLDVRVLSDLREDISGRCFLPDDRTIQLCWDKYELTLLLRSQGVPAPETYAVPDLDALDSLFRRFGSRTPLWCRPRTGTCARGAGAVRNPAQARSWISLWVDMQGVPVTSFTLSEYLPGRDFLCQSLWKDGALILINTFERLSYFGTDNIPTGITSLSSLAKTVVDQRLVDTCREAIRTVDRSATGAFSVDLKEDRQGVARVTEINAGRFLMAMTAFDRVGKHNMCLTYVRLALGEPVGLLEEYDSVAGYYMVRDLDTPPDIFHEDDLFEGVEIP